MRRPATALLVLALACAALPAAEFSGESALRLTAGAVALGPRPPGSPAHHRLQDYIRSRLKQWRCEVIDDAFLARTPRGPVHMNNIIARFPGSSGRAIVFSGHYDTKWLPRIRFLGANDGGSSTGLLLELARVLAGRKRKHDLYLVWFDGEEAFGPWSDTDGIYGSRHLARRWADDGTLGRITALVNVDMIGDRDLKILREYYSTPSLLRRIWQVAADLGYRRHFLDSTGAVEDDHVPFLRLGVTAANLIDFNYGPKNSYWHTEQDTMDKLSPASFEVVGKVLLELLRRLEQ